MLFGTPSDGWRPLERVARLGTLFGLDGGWDFFVKVGEECADKKDVGIHFHWRVNAVGFGPQLEKWIKIMQKPRILIVDDEPGLVRLLALNFEKMDRYEVLTVEDSTCVLEAAANFKPDLLILDWIMPKITGGEVAEQIRADPRVCDTPILFFSAFIMKRDGEQEISGFPAIAKPIGMHELAEAIDEQLKKRQKEVPRQARQERQGRRQSMSS